jgi:hypothetical protein
VIWERRRSRRRPEGVRAEGLPLVNEMLKRLADLMQASPLTGGDVILL